jgi:hypothetical protein
VPDPKPDFAPPAPVPTTTPEPKRGAVPKKIRLAVDALASGQARTVKEAAENFGGISREYLSRSLSKPECAQYLKDKAARAVAMGAARAAAKLNELVDSTSQKVALEAAKYSLDVAGIKPAADPQVNVNIELKAGYVIDLSEPGEPAAKIVNGAVIEAAAKPVD